ncbi:MAG: potassium-transporting ATPase subunit KdpA, partial [Chitinophagaceae bacterium]
MNMEIIGIIITYGLTLLLAILLGKSIARWLKGERSVWNFMAPVEKFIYKLAGINANEEMTWKQHLKALLTINLVWFVYGFFMLINQGSLFLNPDGNPSMSPDLAFNTAISFIVNCNLQHYSGESGLTYLTQVGVIAFFQFVSAATGIAALFVLFKALRDKVTDKLGNFWVFLVQSITRILLPISLVIATILALNGTPTSFDGKDSIVTLQGDSVSVSRGPVAGMVAIKHLGTNGGGWFGANSAHPLE